MKTVEEIALEISKEMGLEDDEANFEFAQRLIAAVDAERGKDAVGWMWQHEDTGNMGVIDQWQIDNGWEEGNPRIHIIGPVFLSPTIPEGMALVPLIPTEEILDAMCDTSRALPDDGDLVIQYNAIIKAAGVTK